MITSEGIYIVFSNFVSCKINFYVLFRNGFGKWSREAVFHHFPFSDKNINIFFVK